VQDKKRGLDMLDDNINKDPFIAFDALQKIDEIVRVFVEESSKEQVSEYCQEFLHDLRLFCRSIYYKEPSEIEKAKTLIEKETLND